MIRFVPHRPSAIIRSPPPARHLPATGGGGRPPSPSIVTASATSTAIAPRPPPLHPTPPHLATFGNGTLEVVPPSRCWDARSWGGRNKISIPSIQWVGQCYHVILFLLRGRTDHWPVAAEISGNSAGGAISVRSCLLTRPRCSEKQRGLRQGGMEMRNSTCEQWHGERY